MDMNIDMGIDIQRPFFFKCFSKYVEGKEEEKKRGGGRDPFFGHEHV